MKQLRSATLTIGKILGTTRFPILRSEVDRRGGTRVAHHTVAQLLARRFSGSFWPQPRVLALGIGPRLDLAAEVVDDDALCRGVAVEHDPPAIAGKVDR